MDIGVEGLQRVERDWVEKEADDGKEEEKGQRGGELCMSAKSKTRSGPGPIQKKKGIGGCKENGKKAYWRRQGMFQRGGNGKTSVKRLTGSRNPCRGRKSVFARTIGNGKRP